MGSTRMGAISPTRKLQYDLNSFACTRLRSATPSGEFAARTQVSSTGAYVSTQPERFFSEHQDSAVRRTGGRESPDTTSLVNQTAFHPHQTTEAAIQSQAHADRRFIVGHPLCIRILRGTGAHTKAASQGQKLRSVNPHPRPAMFLSLSPVASRPLLERLCPS